MKSPAHVARTRYDQQEPFRPACREYLESDRLRGCKRQIETIRKGVRSKDLAGVSKAGESSSKERDAGSGGSAIHDTWDQGT